MSGDIITPKDLELSAMRAWKERAIEAERKLLDYEGKEMLYSGRTELAAFRKREPFVQEVIRLSGIVDAMNKTNSSWSEWESALGNLQTSATKLREWSPT